MLLLLLLPMLLLLWMLLLDVLLLDVLLLLRLLLPESLHVVVANPPMQVHGPVTIPAIPASRSLWNCAQAIGVPYAPSVLYAM